MQINFGDKIKELNIFNPNLPPIEVCHVEEVCTVDCFPPPVECPSDEEVSSLSDLSLEEFDLEFPEIETTTVPSPFPPSVEDSHAFWAVSEELATYKALLSESHDGIRQSIQTIDTLQTANANLEAQLATLRGEYTDFKASANLLPPPSIQETPHFHALSEELSDYKLLLAQRDVGLRESYQEIHALETTNDFLADQNLTLQHQVDILQVFHTESPSPPSTPPASHALPLPTSTSKKKRQRRKKKPSPTTISSAPPLPPDIRPPFGSAVARTSTSPRRSRHSLPHNRDVWIRVADYQAFQANLPATFPGPVKWSSLGVETFPPCPPFLPRPPLRPQL